MSERPTMETDAATTIRALRADCEQYIRERDALREALRELVRLKDLHDRIESYGNPVFVGLGEMVDEYKRCKPLAWERARALLGKGAG